MGNDFGNLYDSSKFTDVILKVGDKTFPVHKAVLAARSKVFLAMFEHDMEESKSNIVNIEHTEPFIMSEFLRYIYTGKIEDMNVDIAIQMFEVADTYCLIALQKECVKVLMKSISINNVCAIAVLADLHSVIDLKAAAMNYIRIYSTQIFSTTDWETLTNKQPRLATEIVRNVVFTMTTNCTNT